ncbi:MAG: glycosyltransferase [Bacilli bacterium]|nr:glycosyltransferase [Bacilli bacterium]
MNNIAILIPCLNEEQTIKSVIDGFKPYNVNIYVYDNNSTDNTSQIAKECGVNVGFTSQKGKGNVVRQMFNEIDADIYVLIDGDNTYFADDFPKMLDKYNQTNCDMLVGDRLSSTYFIENKKILHNIGNKLVKWLINHKYKTNISDIMSGYRILSKKFVQNIDIQSNEFEIETEMTIFALKNNYHIESIPIQYKDRPNGSISKINTIKDGFKIIKYIIQKG